MRVLINTVAHKLWPWLHEVILIQHNEGHRTRHCISCGQVWPDVPKEGPP